ncbi:Asp-tRNA(Asn)/Glu-tRNA(Gln) amidotransferase subunit GatC [bacterium]|nr:Asp-tRNA(Asn)/Glu-tRNA(Gln) amidotransferase subunit GatC [bacterium]
MKFDRQFVYQIANLAKIPVGDDQADTLAGEFEESMKVVDQLTKIKTDGIKPTFQVNNLVNVWREDVVETDQMLTQAQALQNAPRTHQGYFVVERVIDHEA